MPKPQEYTDIFILTKKLFLVGLWGLQSISNPVERPCIKVYKKSIFWTTYTQYVLISKGPISKTSQISGFFKQWLVKFSKLSNNLFCSRFLSNPLVNFFKLSKSKLLLLHSNLLPSVFLSGYAQTFVSFFRFSLHCFNLKKFPKFYVKKQVKNN